MQSALCSARLIASWLLLVAASLIGFIGACLTAALFISRIQERANGDFRAVAVGVCIVGASLVVAFLAFRSIRQLRPEALRMRSSGSGEFEYQVQRFGWAIRAFAVSTIIFSCGSGSLRHKLFVAAASVVGFWVYAHLFFFLHELGHYWAARVAGLELYKFRSGVGAVFWRWKSPGGTLCEWRMQPRGGLVIAWWPEERLNRWKALLFFASGPIASLGVIGLTALFLKSLLPDPASPTAPHLAFVFAILMLFWSGFLLVWNLIPHHVTVGGVRRVSDGLQILRLFHNSQESETDARVSRLLARLTHYRRDRLYDRAWEELRNAFRRYPQAIGRLRICEASFYIDDGVPKAAIEPLEAALAMESLSKNLKLHARALLAWALAAAGDVERARELAEKVLEDSEPKSKLHYLEHFASIPVLDHAPALVPDAARWCETALRALPHAISFTALSAALGVEQGDAEQSEPKLRALLRRRASDGLRALVAFDLALVLARRSGSVREIARLRAKALDWCASRALLRRIERELPEHAPRAATNPAAALPDES